MALLDEVRIALAHELELPDLFRTVVEAIAQTFGYAFVSLYMLEDDVLVLQHHVGYEEVLERIPVTEGVIGRVIRTGEAALLEDVRADADFLGPTPEIVSEVCVPLCDQGQTVGALNLESQGGVRLGDDDLRLMMALSDHISIAIGRARLYTEARRSEARFRALVQDTADMVSIVDARGVRLYASPAYERVLGYRPEELVGQTVEMIKHADGTELDKRFFADLAREPGALDRFETQVRHRDGSPRWLEVIAVNLLDNPDVGGIVVTERDITERKQMEEALRRSEAILADAQRVARIGSGEWDIASNKITWSDEVYHILGTTREASVASFEDFLEHVHPEDRSRVQGVIGQAVLTHEGFEMEVRMMGTAGTETTVLVIGTPLFTDEGRLSGFRGTIQDISDRKRLEEQLRYQAFHDSLTGLPNRRDFIRRLEDALLKASQVDHAVAVLFLDLDRFKVVNDSLGHVWGDKALAAVAARLTAHLRDEDVLARFGGDEFAVLLDRPITVDMVMTIADRILEALQAPIQVRGHDFFVTVSIGIAFTSSTLAEAEDLMQAADVAMYCAKADGPGRYAVFDPSMNARAVERLQLETDLQKAVRRNELVLHYQPKIHVASGAIVAVEALIRWQHPQRGLLYPRDFLQLAEETGLIVPIGRWVLEEACRQASEWQATRASFSAGLMCVNVSAREFHQADLVGQVARILAETGVPPATLELEITEQTAVDSDEVISALLQMKEMGVRLALDDFGTGYAALSSLRRLPIDAVKIDQSFVHEVTKEAKTRAVMQAVTSLAHELGMLVIAEGVETEAQIEAIRDLGIDIVQGAYFANVLPPADCSAFLATRDAKRI